MAGKVSSMTGKFASEQDEMSYAMGMNMAEYLKRNPLPVNPDVALEGIRDYLTGKPRLTPEEYVRNMQALQQRMQDAGRAEIKRLAAENLEAGKKFLAENAKKDGVSVTPTGLQYEVLKAASGDKPTAKDTVRVHYVGTLLNGQKFDSSVDRGEPAEFGVGQVISGWTEALQLMNVGSKYKLYIPAELAYGERGAGQSIPPNSTLVFEVELLAIV